jgi:hypothetical protein
VVRVRRGGLRRVCREGSVEDWWRRLVERIAKGSGVLCAFGVGVQIAFLTYPFVVRAVF